MSGKDDVEDESDWSMYPFRVVLCDPLTVFFLFLFLDACPLKSAWEVLDSEPEVGRFFLLLIWLLFEDTPFSGCCELPRAAWIFVTIGFVNGISGNSLTDSISKLTSSIASKHNSNTLFIGVDAYSCKFKTVSKIFWWNMVSYLSTLQPGQLCTDRWDEKKAYLGQNADDFPKVTFTFFPSSQLQLNKCFSSPLFPNQ